MARRKERPIEPQKWLVRIIRDSRDATRDYWLPAREASELEKQGKLAFDLTNSCYSTARVID